ncbi:MAG: flagellar assembly protein FliH [Asticcacaulis sp.]
MPSDSPAHKKFEFGTVFGDGGHVIATPPPREKKFFTPEEVEAVRAKAYAEGENSALARAQLAQAAAVQALADAAHNGLSGLTDAIHAHKDAAVKLALVCAQKIAAEALERFPEAPVHAALEALGQEIELATRLVLFARDSSEELKASAQEAAMLAGFGGAIQFRDAPAMPKGAFQAVWNDGRAEFNPQQVFDALEAALKEAVEADRYHQSRAHAAPHHS